MCGPKARAAVNTHVRQMRSTLTDSDYPLAPKHKDTGNKISTCVLSYDKKKEVSMQNTGRMQAKVTSLSHLISLSLHIDNVRFLVGT